jgi:chromosomal replication initiation ATPase DnaA
MIELKVVSLPEIYKIIGECEQKLKKVTLIDIHLKPYLNKGIISTPKEIAKEKLQTMICELFSVTWNGVKSTCRNREIVDARHAYFFLATSVLKFSSSAIARDLGFDHSTIIHGRRKIQNLIDTNDPVALIIQQIKERLI